MHDITPVRYFAKHHLDHSYYAGAGHVNHHEQFKNAGYHGVAVTTRDWSGIHQWLERHYPNRYCWTGSTLWFDDARIAAEVALRWA